MKTRTIFGVISRAAALAVCILAFGGARLSAAPASVTLQSAKGTVETRPNDKAPWAAIKAGASLSESAAIKTGPASEAVLKWPQGHVAKIGPLSTLLITQLSKDDKSESTALDMKGGKLLVKTQKMTGASSKFNVKTPTAVAGVRGTEFSVDVAESGASTVVLLEGQLDISGEIVETIMNQNTQLDIPTAPPAQPPAPQEISPELKQELQTEFQNINEVSAAEVPTTTGTAPAGGTAVTPPPTPPTPPEPPDDSAAADQAIQNATDNQLVIPDQTPVIQQEDLPPMPPY